MRTPSSASCWGSSPRSLEMFPTKEPFSVSSGTEYRICLARNPRSVPRKMHSSTSRLRSRRSSRFAMAGSKPVFRGFWNWFVVNRLMYL
ncbi:hypothetical protein AAY473_024577 [Plecturocebus cupreus]